MKKLLVIYGPTAIGKTALALHLAKIFKGELISADSRQVYKAMDIITGKDIPNNSKYIFKNNKLGGYYSINDIKIWGLDLVKPNQDFSVAQYSKIARRTINHITKQNKLPIIEGGTALYIKSIIKNIDTLKIPKNQKLRKELNHKTVNELFETLAQIDPIKAGSLNISDKQNKLRLSRAIEVAQFKVFHTKRTFPKTQNTYNYLLICLNKNPTDLAIAIKKRVLQRIKKGAEKEVKTLLGSGMTWNSQSMSAIGYRLWKPYFENKATLKSVIRKWQNEEIKFAKKQVSWFRHEKNAIWINTDKKGWRKQIENTVKKWYSNN